jgi:exosortase
MAGLAVWTVAMALLYGRALIALAANWQSDANYSHGWVIAPIALALLWRQRERFRALPPKPSNAGLAVILTSISLYVVGTLGAELFLVRVSLIGVLAGTLLYAAGWRHLQLAAFPLAFLLFMIPLPAVVFDRVAVQLQLIASGLGERMLQNLDVAVVRDGNVLQLSTIALEVNDACSGIRSLMTLLAVTTLMAYLFEADWPRRIVIAAGALPLALALNGIRIAATGLAALRFGPWVASGTVHEAAGLAVFVVAVAGLCMLHAAMHRLPARIRFASTAETA